MSASLFFSAIRASISDCVFSLAGVMLRLIVGVAVPESVLNVAPKKPVGRVAVCWRLSAAARDFGQGPCDFGTCCEGVVEALVLSGVDAQEVTFDCWAALMRSSWYSGCIASTVNIATVRRSCNVEGMRLLSSTAEGDSEKKRSRCRCAFAARRVGVNGSCGVRSRARALEVGGI